MARDPRTEELYRQLRLQLPRILVMVGIGLLVAGVIAIIAFVAADSGCNAVTNPTIINGGQISGSSTSGSFCGHEHGFLTISFLTLVLGAVLIGLGGMILPTLRARDARMDRDKASASSPSTGAPLPPSESEPVDP
jgi:hypothetical protein